MGRKSANTFPPITAEEMGGDFIVLRRDVRSPTIVVILPNQDSYELDGGLELEMYLKALGVPADFHVRDYVWNFYGAKVDLSDMSLEPLSFEQASSYLKRPGLVTF